MTSDTTVRTYDKIAQHFSDTHYETTFWAKEFIVFKQLLTSGKIIDIGCGAGRDAVLFVESGFDYTGIDASSGMLSQARKRVKRGKFLLMDLYKLNFPKEVFDGFWAAASLLHVPKANIASVLQGIAQIIKPGGIGFISVKQKTGMDEGMIQEKKYGGIKRYFAFYDRSEFQSILETNGFKVIRKHILKENDVYKTQWLCYFVKK